MNWKIAVLTLFLPIYLDAQNPQITLTAPTYAQSFQEGDDFFTTVMNNPRDFETRRDFMWEEKFNESTIDETPNGIWSGTVSTNGSYVFPLFHGFENALNLGETGANYPLDASKYTLFSSFNICSERTRKVVYWTKTQKWPDGSQKIDASKDGIYTPNTFIPHPDGEPVLDIFDLSAYPAWSDFITGIRVDPTYSSTTSNVQYDWLRVSDPNSAPILSIEWDTDNVPWINARGTTPAVNIYIDDNNTGFDGAFVGRTLFTDAQGNSAGQFDLHTSTLPPGEYYFYLELRNNVDTDVLLATSGYSAKITINGKPHLKFTNPSYTSGPDYATEVIGNPWDMNQSADISNAYDPVNQTNFLNPVFTNGYFLCYSGPNPNPGGQPHSDVKLFMNIDQKQ